jgi:hypothetical protein
MRTDWTGEGQIRRKLYTVQYLSPWPKIPILFSLSVTVNLLFIQSFVTTTTSLIQTLVF